MWMKSPRDNQKFRHWINTRDDFWIRVRCSDGLEMGGWLSDAIEETRLDAVKPDPLAVRCITDLCREAKLIRNDAAYRSRPWSEYVELP
jgi:hypothetical protein